MKHRHKIFLSLFLCAGLLLALYLWSPWKPFLARHIETMLVAKGFQNVSFQIDNIGPHQAVISNIILGKKDPLILPSLTLKYSPRELWDGNLQAIKLSGLHLQIIETDDGWSFAGMDVLAPRKEGDSAKTTDIPALLASLPFKDLTIDNSDFKISGKSIRANIPFILKFGSSLDIQTEPAALAAGSAIVSLGKLSLKIAPVGVAQWKGQWDLDSVSFGEDMPIPSLKGVGTIAIEKSAINFKSDFLSADKTYEASVGGNFDINQTGFKKITLISASFPFKQGIISTRNVALKIPITIPLSVRNVSIGDLLASFTGERVSATGTFSGNIPLTIDKAGNYFFGKGALNADSVGLIQMPGELIPGDNEQVALVRQILENLHYSVLSAGMNSGKNGEMTVKLSLEGNNPDVYNGRPVKLNLNLTGDLLDIIQQNLMLFGSPEKLIEQGTHE